MNVLGRLRYTVDTTGEKTGYVIMFSDDVAGAYPAPFTVITLHALRLNVIQSAF